MRTTSLHPAAKRGLAIALALVFLPSLAAKAQEAGAPTHPAPLGTRYAYTNAAGRELSLYVAMPPQAGSSPAPAVVFFHGGGWVQGGPWQFNTQAEHLAARGIAAIQVQYRLIGHGDPLDAPIADAVSAWTWVRQHAVELHLDPKRIALAGGSAGGHLAAYLATIAARSAAEEPALLILYNPVVLVGPGGCCGSRVIADPQAISPLDHVRAGLPPTLILHGDSDTTVPPVLVKQFTEAMKHAGNDCTLVLYPGQKHAFFNKPEYEAKTTAEVDRFLQAHGWESTAAGR